MPIIFSELPVAITRLKGSSFTFRGTLLELANLPQTSWSCSSASAHLSVIDACEGNQTASLVYRTRNDRGKKTIGRHGRARRIGLRVSQIGCAHPKRLRHRVVTEKPPVLFQLRLVAVLEDTDVPPIASDSRTVRSYCKASEQAGRSLNRSDWVSHPGSSVARRSAVSRPTSRAFCRRALPSPGTSDMTVPSRAPKSTVTRRRGCCHGSQRRAKAMNSRAAQRGTRNITLRKPDVNPARTGPTVVFQIGTHGFSWTSRLRSGAYHERTSARSRT